LSLRAVFGFLFRVGPFDLAICRLEDKLLRFTVIRTVCGIGTGFLRIDWSSIILYI
jgi:hypothetical protein